MNTNKYKCYDEYMLKDLFDHGQTLQKILEEENKQHDWKKELKKHRYYLVNLQHERLIHLLVTITVALAILILGTTFISNLQPQLGIVVFLLICLFIPYLFHYRKLENKAQDWYLLSKKLEEKLD